MSYQGDFQRVVMSLAVDFVNTPLDTLDAAISDALAQVGLFTESDRAYVFTYDFVADTTSNTHEWCAEGIEPVIEDLQDVPLAGLDDWLRAHRAEELMHVPLVPDLPEGSALREILEPQGILTLITVPLIHGHECLGFVGFDAVTHVKNWTPEEVALLRVLAEMFTNAFMRRDRERQLIAARREAEAANQAKSRLMATISHELRTPMNGVLGMTELLLSSSLDARQRTFALAVQRSGEHLMALVNDVLDLAKAESGRLELELVATDPAVLTRDTVDLARSLAEDRGLTIDVTIPEHLPSPVLADQVKLRQILTNLVGNAIKFTEAGGVQVAVEALSDADGMHLRWQVRDTGPGLSQADIRRVFEPFVQAGGAMSQDAGGTGLGLAIVRELVHFMGGEVDVDSAPGQGATFWFTVPVRVVGAASAGTAAGAGGAAAYLPSSAVAAPALDGAAADRPLRGYRVLIAEDNGVNRMLAQAHLQALGCVPLLAVDGAEALAVLEREPVDVVLMDCRMPVLDGMAATAEWRRREEPGQAVPIIALTANAMAGDRDVCLAAGMDGFLAKPYTRADLEAELLRWLRPRE